MQPWPVIDLELGDARPALVGDGRYESVHFAIKLQVLRHIAAHRLQCAAVIMELHLRCPRDQPIGDRRWKPAADE